jgi:hypothetical protein
MQGHLDEPPAWSREIPDMAYILSRSIDSFILSKGTNAAAGADAMRCQDRAH